jgi:CRISPR-associated protein Csm4
MHQFNIPIIQLHFQTPLHISNERSDYAAGSTYLHSDALVAAIFFAWNQMGYSDWIPTEEQTDAGFTISSLFPFSTSGKQPVYFLPKPLIKLENEKIDDTVLRKKLKKVNWIDWDIFHQTVQGISMLALDKQVNGSFRSLQTLSEGPIISSNIIPRVRVSRAGKEDTSIFYMERHYFGTGSGLYALVQYHHPEAEYRVRTAFRFLGEEGIGTDRNIGNGKFVPIFGQSIVTNIPKTADMGINLGLYCPQSQEELSGMINHQDTGYDIIKRGGWLSEPYNTWRKKHVYMFKEGSAFYLGPTTVIDPLLPVKGKLTDLKPITVSDPLTHPVWRSGRTLFIPFNVKS